MASKGPECSICYEHYDDQSKCPRLLSCGHSFCSRCLERLLRGNTIDCPKCRNPVVAPSGVDGLLKNFALLDIVNEAAPKQNTGTTGLQDCEACDEKHPANLRCLDCRENMCKTAAQFHTRNKTSRDHRVVTLEELEANPQLASVSLTCQKHNDKFRFFDEKCGQVVCRECIALEHFGHECLPLAEAASKYRPHVEDLITQTNFLSYEAIVAEERVKAVRLELKNAHEKGAADIHNFFTELHRVLSTREQQLTTEFDRIYSKKENTLMEQQQRLGSWRNLLEISKQRAESTIQSSGSAAELLISIRNTKSELTNALSKKPLFKQIIDSKLSVFFNGGGDLMNMLKKAGEVSGDQGNGRPVSLSGAVLIARQGPYITLKKAPAGKKR